ncbi:MAG: DUF4199 domain-containing protein [Rikenellaceae bacterium]
MNNNAEKFELAKFRLNSAAMAGLIIGVADSLLILGADFFRNYKVVTQMASFVEFAIVCWGLYYFTRQYAQKREEHVVNFGHVLGFQMTITLFASILIGLSSYAVMFVVSPEYYLSTYKELFSSELAGLEMEESFSEVYTKLGSSPLIVVVYTIIGTALKWFFPAMIISVMLKKKKIVK